MHRIDAPGATIDNKFTEGNPGLGIPATELSADWLNDVQGEVVTVVESAGITLVKGTITQLRSAIEAMIALGGAAFANFTIPNNQAATDVTGLVFNKVTYKAAHIRFDIMRSTNSNNATESGTLFAS